ncbi:tRNA (adenosine(37)-N6)-dimethylallyltransferase MiaA [bacterium]|nr:tRNA (adenosine(37)-N6)-dimethylallyltransferase MiaA [bacterium]
MKNLIVIVGPTGIGKTSLSIEIAKHFKCDIISADSRQFFKEMTIGTAKPTTTELAEAPHHFISNKSINQKYSAGTFEVEAIAKLKELHKTNDVAILVGGSGLYVNAVCDGIDDIPFDLKVREQLNKELEEFGAKPLREELKEKDPEHYARMNTKNPQRLVRAIEVCRITGKTYSSFRKNTVKKRDFNIIKIGLNADREVVYNRINQRVDLMMEKGLLDEVKSLEKNKNLNALNTVGYKELFAYLDDYQTLEDAVDLIKQNSRNFAKRQLTWFKKDLTTNWFEPNKLPDILNYLEKEIN